MSIFYNTETKEFPRHFGDLALLGWEDGMDLPENWVEVAIDPQPELLINQKAIIQMPKLIKGTWVASWKIEQRSQNEIDEMGAYKPKDLTDE